MMIRSTICFVFVATTRCAVSENLRRPFFTVRRKLESIRGKISRNDIRFSSYAPAGDLVVENPRQVVQAVQSPSGLSAFLWGPREIDVSTMAFTDILCPDEILRVHLVVTRTETNACCLVERRSMITIPQIGGQIVSSTVDWYRSVRTPRFAYLNIVDDCDSNSLHVLAKQFMFLYLLKGTGIAVSPIFLSAPRLVGLRKGCLRTRRFLVTKQYGELLTKFLATYPVKPLPLLETLRIGRQLTRVIYKLHKHGIAHGSVCTDSFVFVQGTNLKKGFRLMNFSNSVLDERGLSKVALGDLAMLFSVLTDMNPAILSLAVDDVRKLEKNRKLGELEKDVKCIYRHLVTHLFVSEVDYAELFACMDNAIMIASNDF